MSSEWGSMSGECPILDVDGMKVLGLPGASNENTEAITYVYKHAPDSFNDWRDVGDFTGQGAIGCLLSCTHCYADFSVRFDIYTPPSAEKKGRIESIMLPFNYGCGMGNGTFQDVRPETKRAREDWLQKNLFLSMRNKSCMEAIEAFKVEYSALIGTTIWAGLSTKAIYNAWRAFDKRKENWNDSMVFRPLLAAGWDGFFSHIKPHREILNYFPKKYFPHLTEGTLSTAISGMKLPNEPGPIKIDIDPESYFKFVLINQSLLQHENPRILKSVYTDT